MRGKSQTRRSSGCESAQTSGPGRKQSRLTSVATTLHEDAPLYTVRSSGFSRSAAAQPPEGGTPNPAALLRFIDLFCGIGGFRLAFERAGCECVFSSDWNAMAQITYEANFGERPHGDIYSVPDNAIPPHHILCAGFPCQPFSIAGVSKKLSLGKKHGFEDVEQGNLFFKLAELIDHHRPDAFVLENVKHLKSTREYQALVSN